LVASFATSARADDDAATDDPIDARTAEDAAIGRSYFAPTALTAPHGSATLHVRMPLFPALAGSLGVSIYDRLEVFVGAGAAIDLFDDESNNPHTLIAGGAKLQVLRDSRGAVAIEASAYRRPGYHEVDPFDPIEWDVPRLVTGEMGIVGTLCIDHACKAMASGHAHYIKEIWGGDQRVVWGGASLVAGGGRSRFVLDATVPSVDDERGFLGYAGYRYATRTFSFDVGAVLVAAEDDAFPWPTFAVSGRFE
jgi:hypothetical protein